MAVNKETRTTQGDENTASDLEAQRTHKNSNHIAVCEQNFLIRIPLIRDRSVHSLGCPYKGVLLLLQLTCLSCALQLSHALQLSCAFFGRGHYYVIIQCLYFTAMPKSRECTQRLVRWHKVPGMDWCCNWPSTHKASGADKNKPYPWLQLQYGWRGPSRSAPWLLLYLD